MELGFDFSQEMRTWVSPSLIEANHILSLSRQELQQAIEAEIADNPALEVEEHTTCPVCGHVLDGNFCTYCLINKDETPRTLERTDDSADQLISLPRTREDDDEYDPLSFVAQSLDIREQILQDARTILDPEDHPIAEYLVDSIDDRGLLSCDLEELAALVRRPLTDIERIVIVIQSVAPIGVGARDLKESLLLQLDYVESTGIVAPRALRSIIEQHLDGLGAHRYGVIGRELGLKPEAIDEAREFIRVHLNPFPLQSNQAKSWRTPAAEQYVAPDVVYSIKDGELVCEVIDTLQFHLRLNPLYDRLSANMSPRRGANGSNGSNGSHGANGSAGGPLAATTNLVVTSGADREHVRGYSNRARLFIANIQQRRETLWKISNVLLELQEPFLRGTVRDLKPLTRAIVAQQAGVHESTVSRATANKYAMLPNRKVIPFSDFFTPSLSAKDIIKELILQEAQKGGQLTDRRICDLLMDQGIRIARRTVAKYRAELGILPSTMR